MQPWMIYGANGYTGRLIAREAVRRGHRPILAGRNREAVGRLADELKLEARVFDLSKPQVENTALVVHCAGPFSQTSGPMVEACLAQRVHYLDITGELEVFESVFAADAAARERGITFLPGVGFDVVPTDSMAAMLAKALPNAEELWLAFFSEGGGISPGTLKTSIEGMARGGAIRRDGRIVRVPFLFDVREIPFSIGPRLAATIPWGDISSAYRSTGIPNIRVYTAQSPRSIARQRRMQRLLPLLRITPLRRLLQWYAGRRSGPSAERRERARMHLWGRAARGNEEVTMTMTVPEGYKFTALSAVSAVERVLGGAARPGAFTPSTLLGSDFVLTIEGVVIHEGPGPQKRLFRT